MRRASVRIRLLTPLSLALVLAAAGSTFGEVINTRAVYQIKAKHSGKCLEVDGGPNALRNGAPVVQRDCNNATNQQWSFTYVGAGFYKITAKHSGKALDVFGGMFSTANNVIVEQWEYNGGSNQIWYVDDLHNGYYAFVVKHSGKSLEIFGASMENGAQAKQWDFWSGDNQQWQLTEIRNRPPCNSTEPLISSLIDGNAVLTTTHPNLNGPFPRSLDWRMKFSDCRSNVSIIDFPTITYSSADPPNNLRITLPDGGSGSFDSSNGRILIPLTLLFTNTNALVGNSTLQLNLVAEGTDLVDAGTGQVTLRGTGTFAGGALNGYQGTLVITGRLSPIPR